MTGADKQRAVANIAAPAPVLLSTDGSAEARLALRASVDLAGRMGAPLHLVHAWLQPIPYEYMSMQYGTVEFRDEAEAVLRAESRRAARAGLKPAHAYLERGRPGMLIGRLAGRIDARLLVAGSRGLGAFGRLVIGSVSDELVRYAPCPVLVCRGERRSWPPARVVVGDDFSDDAWTAVLSAARIAEAIGVSLVLAHAIPSRYAPGGSPAKVRIRQDIVQAATRALLGRADAIRLLTHTPVRTTVQIGDAARVLTSLVGGSDPGLLVVGRRGQGIVKRVLLGSVSAKALHSARGPMLVVPPGAQAI